ncbi:hypothetical protein PN458_14085, partial [Nodularia spumigena CS-336/02]|nr:hypothetical protein [Nodularia spumigena CS-589/07]MDB9366930.1 hypothetical protein [Nodularia spumigena CS-588/02A10]MDB9499754.1 hypothetical protein [Nodularia spumigena CS-336/02]
MGISLGNRDIKSDLTFSRCSRALPPDLIKVGSDERAQLNFFLYQVRQNRNVDWVSKEFSGRNSRINK